MTHADLERRAILLALTPPQAVETPRAPASGTQVKKEKAIQQYRIAAVSVRERAPLERADEKQNEVHPREHETNLPGEEAQHDQECCRKCHQLEDALERHPRRAA